MATDGKKTYLVDVHWDVAKCYRVQADSREDAVAKIEARLAAGDLSYLEDGCESTDDTEVLAAGETDENGEEIFY